MRLREIIQAFWRRDTPPSADTAKQRLQVLVALDRTDGGCPDFLPLMQRELIQVIRKYVEVEEEHVNVDFERGNEVSMLEVNIEIPNEPPLRAVG